MRWRPNLRAVALIGLGLWLLAVGRPTAAQTDSPIYWRFDAPSRIDHLVVTDFNADGLDEFALYARNDRVIFLAGDGTPLYDVRPGVEVFDILAVDRDGQRVLAVAQGDGVLIVDPVAQRTTFQPVAFRSSPVQLVSLPVDTTSDPLLLIALSHGAIVALDGAGNIAWQHEALEDVEFDAAPRMLPLETETGGAIAFAYFTPRGFSRIRLVDDKGTQQWQRPFDGQVTTLTRAPFSAAGNQNGFAIAVGTSTGLIRLFSPTGSEGWTRTLNKPITALAASAEPIALLAGTDVGRLTAYSPRGQRLWERTFYPTASHRVAAVRTYPVATDAGANAVVTLEERGVSTDAPIESFLLSADGTTVARYPSQTAPQLNQLLDSNNDAALELLLVQFGTLEMRAPPTSKRTTLARWETPYRLFAVPSAVAVADLNGDAVDEILIGTTSGLLHRINADSTLSWAIPIEGELAAVDIVAQPLPDGPALLVTANETDVRRQESRLSHTVHQLSAAGRQLWTTGSRPGHAIDTLVFMRDGDEGPTTDVVVAASSGLVAAYTMNGDTRWEVTLDLPVERMALLYRDDAPVLGIATAEQLSLYTLDGIEFFTLYQRQLMTYLTDDPEDSCATPNQLLDRLSAGELSIAFCYGQRMTEWESLFGRAGEPATRIGNSVFVPRADATVERYQLDDDILTDIETLTGVVSAGPTTLGGPGRPGYIVAEADGDIQLYSDDGARPQQLLRLESRPSFLQTVRGPSADIALLVITENGLVQLYGALPNYPPYLTNFRLERAQNQYNVTLAINDIEQDEVTLRLVLESLATGERILANERAVTASGDQFWVVQPEDPEAAYWLEFAYADASHEGVIKTRVEPLATAAAPGPPAWQTAALILALGTPLVLFLVIRQRNLIPAQARRFYARVGEDRTQLLRLLEERYVAMGGNADFLLNLASHARRHDDRLVASLADGLFLIGERPQAGIPIIAGAIEDMAAGPPPIADLAWWQARFQTTHALIRTTSITELVLQRSELANLAENSAAKPSAEHYAALLQVVDSLDRSERVEQAEDRLFYLNEASVQLRQAERRLASIPLSLDATLLQAWCDRWSGLISAALEALRGRANLEVHLKTKRIAPAERTSLSLEITNDGRAAAEQIVVSLTSGTSAVVHTPQRLIPYLSPGRTEAVDFTLTPPVAEQFRVTFHVSYDDRQRVGKQFDYADQVHILSPPANFTRIENPYAPGTPLRKHSALFYGREALFDFIATEVGRHAEQKVLILVGQRRTGKTSALLRLENHLPPWLIPVYIDCQSLGVVPGMSAFFQDLAWLVAETLENRDIFLDVPDVSAVADNPSHWFQRTFLPDVRARLPVPTTLLFVFDEFEAFENLVRDKILPPTLFPVLRNLMQHGEGLSFIFTGTRRLEQMTSDYWSVLFNIAMYRRIDFLDHDAALKLITEPVSPALEYDDLALNKLLRITAGHPYFLQLVCYTLVKRANQTRTSYVTISDVNEAVDEMLRLGEVHFAYLWQQSSEVERIILTAIAHLMDDGPFRTVDLLRALEPFNLELAATDLPGALDTLVERDVMRRSIAEGVPLFELKIGLVGLWVEQNKSLSRLYESEPGAMVDAPAANSPNR